MRAVKNIVLVLMLLFSLVGCNSVAKDFGGSITVNLDPNVKLETITWKNSSLWYLTRPMKDSDVPEVHVFQQSSEWGVFEGKVTIIESKE